MSAVDSYSADDIKRQKRRNQVGLPGTSYRFQLVLINDKWVLRLLKGKEAIASYIFQEENMSVSGFPNQNLIVNWVLRTVANPNINPHLIMKTVQEMTKQARENIDERDDK